MIGQKEATSTESSGNLTTIIIIVVVVGAFVLGVTITVNILFLLYRKKKNNIRQLVKPDFKVTYEPPFCYQLI